MLTFIIASLSCAMFYSNRPLTIILILLVIRITTRFLLNIFLRAWLIIRIVLIFLGGIIVIFIYVTTLASSDKITFTKQVLIIGLVFRIISHKKNWFILSSPTNFPILFERTRGELLLFLTSYLILSLFLVVKTSSWEKGALRYK